MANLPPTALLESSDICQSVLGSFFVRINLGQYSLNTPEQLVNLLATMARSKLAGQLRRQQTQRRDPRRIAAVECDEQPASTPGPGTQVAAKDLLEEVR